MGIDADFKMSIPQDADFPDGITVERDPGETREYVHPGVLSETEKDVARLTAEGAVKDDRIFELEKALVYLRSRGLMHTEYCTAILGDNGEKPHPLERVSGKQEIDYCWTHGNNHEGTTGGIYPKDECPGCAAADSRE